MELLTQAGRAGLLTRFDTFFDAVLDWLQIDFGTDSACATLVFQAQDASSPSGWSDVVFRVEGLRSVRLTRPDMLSVISFGLQFLCIRISPRLSKLRLPMRHTLILFPSGNGW